MSSAHLFWTVAIAVLLLHRFVLANRPQVWFGALVPALWLIASAVFVAQGKVDGPRAWFTLLIALVMLLGLWNDGQDARRKRLKREDERIDALNTGRGLGGRAGP